ncbi:gap junction beta-6 protein-like [Crotalus adamanteus]|uniref:Gap junction beta-6 protein-like n=1 Tax=Crotalus adamanteus TaxID=8729 RepID=A0AAW1C414_CROAD
MEKEAITTLLSGTGDQAPGLCRASLASLTVFRLGFLILGAATVWRDESADLLCNSTRPSCLLACWDEAFPISPLNLFLLQTASLLTHGLACVFLFPSRDVQGKGLGGQSQPWSHGLKLRLHLVNLLAKTLLEGLFVMTFHSLYSHYPETFDFPPSVSCPEATWCTIQGASRKEAFGLLIAGTSWASISVAVIAACLAIREMLQTTFSSCKMSLMGKPLLHSMCSPPSKWDLTWKRSYNRVPV